MTVLELREKVNRGLFSDNLFEAGAMCRQLMEASPHPVALFVLQQLFYDIATEWERRPVTVEEAENVAAQISGAIDNVLNKLDDKNNECAMYQALDALVNEYVLKVGYGARLF